jgi:hypothetical protein
MVNEKIELNDLVEMKKPHPCIHHSKLFQVVRLGADLKIQCQGCGNVIIIPRLIFDKRVKKVISHHQEVLFK